MKIISKQSKPKLINDKSPLCNFRSSKGYLWGLVRDRLDDLQSQSTRPIHILDAACHSLITRDMFPEAAFYYGLDISSLRLSTALKAKRPNDVLYRADLSRDLPLDSMFDVVVSCNTMSHLPLDQQEKALSNLIASCLVSGDLIINFTISENNMFFLRRLLDEFASVEPIYFDSIFSHNDESSGNIARHNIEKKIISNEVNLPNEASLHRQVLFHARERLLGVNNSGKAPRSIEKVVTLSSVPNVVLFKFADDLLALQQLKIDSNKDVVIFTPALFASDYGITLRRRLTFQVVRLDLDLELSPGIERVIILGLEKGWIDDGASDRLAINRLKEMSDLSIIFATVDSRDNQPCQPSVVALDV